MYLNHFYVKPEGIIEALFCGFIKHIHSFAIIDIIYVTKICSYWGL